ncbi:class I SAM-dependent methyltransferase [Streptomyces genisteinicus]|uniref:Methyltransferase domain-containing protein n=1 Tax=Streptomyces genisteinicus TaxID=2768068 RepID=A0A7H0I2F9_9ACTN|nr:class I SAM-dependent methyltransferase [Streptomyces genisteinicus]QNP66975.1 methyltransferase domain-containing protein [Streptomyces genisteinicus]
MFTAQGPTLTELAVQALSSTRRGYDLLAPAFDHTPFRTPDAILDPVREALETVGPFGAGLDICCGTGAGTALLRRVCTERVTGVDFSAGMLDVAARTSPAGPGPRVDWVQADARALPFRGAFDLAVSFGAFGHFLPAERPLLFAQAHAALRPGGCFAFPVVAPPGPDSWLYWALLGFDAAMRVRNALWRPRFVMYYRTFPLPGVLADLRAAGFSVELVPLAALGRRDDGAPRARLVIARRAGRPVPSGAS